MFQLFTMPLPLRCACSVAAHGGRWTGSSNPFSVHGYDRDIALALALQVGGDRSAADAALRTVIDKQAGGAAYNIAQVYALRNDATETFVWLDRAWSNRDSGIGHPLFDPFILRFKDDPRLAAFCRKVGLPVPGEASARKST